MLAKVTSLKNIKTVIVVSSRSIRHPRYLKIVKRQRKFSCHLDKDLKLSLGQRVEIKEMPPKSARKRWFVVRAL